MRRFLALLALLSLLLAPAARALGPHEVALLVNRNSEDSREVATAYAALRDIPAVNIILLDVPERGEQDAISEEDFRRAIFEPTLSEIRKRGIADHILAWVYAPGFPSHLTTEPALSLCGATFVRGQLPDMEKVRRGLYRSPLFAGPDREGGPYGESRSLEYFTTVLKNQMPIPSMMLGWAGTRGMTTDAIIQHLSTTKSADGLRPDAPVWMATNDDIRTTARHWQLKAAIDELQALKVPTLVAREAPATPDGLGGALMGEAMISAATVGRFHPGALAENLTSFGGVFRFADQTKLTAWLQQGAAAAAGTVSEPYAMWTKFPNARIFAHSARGCTALEAYQLAVYSPLQLLAVGDPLSAPFAQPLPVTLHISPLSASGSVSGTVELAAQLMPGATNETPDFLYLLDGRALPTPPGSKVTVDTTRWPDGWHDIRVVAYRAGNLRHQSFAQQGFLVQNQGLSVTLRAAGPTNTFDVDHQAALEVAPTGAAMELAVISQGRIVARCPTNGASVVRMDPRLLGVGAHELQAVAVYPGNIVVRSAPLAVRFVRSNAAPQVKGFLLASAEGDKRRLTVDADDVEKDRVFAIWQQDLFATRADRDLFQLPAGSPAMAQWDNQTLKIDNPDVRLAPCVYGATSVTGLTRLAVEAYLTPGADHEKHPAAGLAFNIQANGDFDFFGWFWNSSSWSFGRCASGQVQRLVARGAPCATNRWASLALFAPPGGGLQAEVDGRMTARWSEGRWGRGGVGIFAGQGPTTLRQLKISPCRRADLLETTAGLQLNATSSVEGIWLRLSDGRSAVEVPAALPAGTQ